MKYLTLVRHAHARPASAGLSDFDRPLSSRGQQEARQIGQQLAQQHIRPDRLLTSPALRALTTADALAQALGLPAEAVQHAPAIYEAAPGTLLSLLHAIDDTQHDVLLCGHNPALTLVSGMLADTLDDMPPGGVVRLALPLAHWADLGTAPGTLVLRLAPERGS